MVEGAGEKLLSEITEELQKDLPLLTPLRASFYL